MNRSHQSDHIDLLIIMFLLIKNLSCKFGRWYRGYIDIKNQGSTIIVYPPSTTKRLILFMGGFWLKHWPILLPIIVGAIVALFIHFDSKPNSKAPQKHNRMPTVHTIE